MASCAAWIHGISLVVFKVFDPAPVTGWVVVGLLAFAMTAGLTILLYEMGHAANLNEDVVDPEEFDGLGAAAEVDGSRRLLDEAPLLLTGEKRVAPAPA